MSHRRFGVWVFFYLGALVSLAGAQISSSAFYVTRSEQAPGLESFSVRVSVTIPEESLTLGEDSYAVFTTPGGKEITGDVGSPRRGDIGIAATMVISTLDEVAGSWGILINGGVEEYEDLTLIVQALTAESFRSYPPFPEFAGVDGSEVILAHGSGSASAGQSGEGVLSNSSSGEFRYTFPVGGPYFVYSQHNGTLPTIQIRDAADTVLGNVRFTSKNSERRVHFNVTPDSLPFEASAAVSDGALEVFMCGVNAGSNYRLLSSETLGVWHEEYSFVAESNAHFYEVPVNFGNRFIMLEKVE